MKLQNSMNLFLMYGGNALEAMNYYNSVFKESKIIAVTLNSVNDRGVTGSLLNGQLELYGYTIMFMDMEEKYFENHNTSTSLLINCESRIMFDDLFEKLKCDGNVIMGPESVGNLSLCTWIIDKFGFCWQLVLK